MTPIALRLISGTDAKPTPARQYMKAKKSFSMKSWPLVTPR
ncbi:hypothetical protein ACKI14_43085 [Streptomyces turgidiscabies]